MKLNFEGVTDFDQIKIRFVEDARSIMLDHDLVRDKYIWQITALELYLNLQNVWSDLSTHGSPEQLKSGSWYVHRDGKLARKRLGIDITAGSRNPEIHAGLLIAAINGTDGSGKAVKTILRGDAEDKSWKYSDNDMALLQKHIHGNSIHADAPWLRLVRRSVPREGTLWAGPRKNLPASLQEPFKSCCLRIATWQTSPVMKPL